MSVEGCRELEEEKQATESVGGRRKRLVAHDLFFLNLK